MAFFKKLVAAGKGNGSGKGDSSEDVLDEASTIATQSNSSSSSTYFSLDRRKPNSLFTPNDPVLSAVAFKGSLVSPSPLLSFNLGLPAPPTNVSYDPVQGTLAVGTLSGHIVLFGKGRTQIVIPPPPASSSNINNNSNGANTTNNATNSEAATIHGAGIKFLQHKPGTRYLVAINNRDQLVIANLATGRCTDCVSVLRGEFDLFRVSCLAVSKVHTTVFVGTDIGKVIVYNVTKPLELPTTIQYVPPLPHGTKSKSSLNLFADNLDSVQAIAVCPVDPSDVLIGYMEGVHLYSMITYTIIKTFTMPSCLPSNCGGLTSLAWRPDGRMFVAAFDYVLVFWKLSEPNQPYVVRSLDITILDNSSLLSSNVATVAVSKAAANITSFFGSAFGSKQGDAESSAEKQQQQQQEPASPSSKDDKKSAYLSFLQAINQVSWVDSKTTPGTTHLIVSGGMPKSQLNGITVMDIVGDKCGGNDLRRKLLVLDQKEIVDFAYIDGDADSDAAFVTLTIAAEQKNAKQLAKMTSSQSVSTPTATSATGTLKKQELPPSTSSLAPSESFSTTGLYVLQANGFSPSLGFPRLSLPGSVQWSALPRVTTIRVYNKELPMFTTFNTQSIRNPSSIVSESSLPLTGCSCTIRSSGKNVLWNGDIAFASHTGGLLSLWTNTAGGSTKASLGMSWECLATLDMSSVVKSFQNTRVLHDARFNDVKDVLMKRVRNTNEEVMVVVTMLHVVVFRQVKNLENTGDDDGDKVEETRVAPPSLPPRRNSEFAKIGSSDSEPVRPFLTMPEPEMETARPGMAMPEPEFSNEDIRVHNNDDDGDDNGGEMDEVERMMAELDAMVDDALAESEKVKDMLHSQRDESSMDEPEEPLPRYEPPTRTATNKRPSGSVKRVLLDTITSPVHITPAPSGIKKHNEEIDTEGKSLVPTYLATHQQRVRVLTSKILSLPSQDLLVVAFENGYIVILDMETGATCWEWNAKEMVDVVVSTSLASPLDGSPKIDVNGKVLMAIAFHDRSLSVFEVGVEADGASGKVSVHECGTLNANDHINTLSLARHPHEPYCILFYATDSHLHLHTIQSTRSNSYEINETSRIRCSTNIIHSTLTQFPTPEPGKFVPGVLALTNPVPASRDAASANIVGEVRGAVVSLTGDVVFEGGVFWSTNRRPLEPSSLFLTNNDSRIFSLQQTYTQDTVTTSSLRVTCLSSLAFPDLDINGYERVKESEYLRVDEGRNLKDLEVAAVTVENRVVKGSVAGEREREELLGSPSTNKPAQTTTATTQEKQARDEIFSKTAQSLNERGQRLNQLEQKMGDLEDKSRSFLENAKKLNEMESKKKWWQL